MKSNFDVLIAGAGIGGLTTALALLRFCKRVKVLEQTAVLQEVGAGLQLSPNATRVLASLGLQSELDAFGFEPEGKELRLWNSGETWPLFNLGETSRSRYGSPYCMVHRADLHQALTRAVLEVQPDAIQLSAKCVDVVSSSSGGYAIQLSDGSLHYSDIIVAADGIRSLIRSKLIAEDRPRYSGCLAWRAVVPMARLPQHLQRPVGVNWVGPGAHIVNYPLRSGTLMNFGGVVEKSSWESESWVDAGSMAECMGDFEGWHEDIHTITVALLGVFEFRLHELIQP